MNIKPSGKQPVMHPGQLPDGRQQFMEDNYGRPKELKQALKERRENTPKMVQEGMIACLQQFDDFKHARQRCTGKHSFTSDGICRNKCFHPPQVLQNRSREKDNY